MGREGGRRRKKGRDRGGKLSFWFRGLVRRENREEVWLANFTYFNFLHLLWIHCHFSYIESHFCARCLIVCDLRSLIGLLRIRQVGQNWKISKVKGLKLKVLDHCINFST